MSRSVFHSIRSKWKVGIPLRTGFSFGSEKSGQIYTTVIFLPETALLINYMYMATFSVVLVSGDQYLRLYIADKMDYSMTTCSFASRGERN